MATKSGRKRVENLFSPFANEQEFLAFTKSHLSQDFPNPERIGCPDDADLQRMGKHPIAKRDDDISKHLTRCLPCFNRYMEILGQVKRLMREK